MVATWGDIATISVSKRDESWRTLRRMRSSPPGAAGVDEARAATFQAALEQSEQLFRAAEAVGPEVRPMLVFYGLSQAGRAIAAASPRLSDKEWRLTGHGVSVKETRDQVNIGKVAIEAHKGGSPQAVAAALGSRFLPPKASVQLEELWLLIPEANEELLPALWDIEWRRPALRFSASERSEAHKGWDKVTLTGAPAAVANARDAKAVTKWLSGYPTLEGWQAGSERGSDKPEVTVSIPGGINVVVYWPYPKDESQHFEPVYIQRAVWYRRQWWVLPAVAGLDRPIHPLLAWWAVLLALSSLARYEPEAWARMTKVDLAESPAV